MQQTVFSEFYFYKLLDLSTLYSLERKELRPGEKLPPFLPIMKNVKTDFF